LHEKIEALQSRIKELEAALAQLQSKITSDPHPLLIQSLKAATDSPQPGDATLRDNGPDDEDLIDTFGSLTIDTKGETVWYVRFTPRWWKFIARIIGTALMLDPSILFL
jgi:hypothetical protein